MVQSGHHNILIFDSGLGGLSLVPDIRKNLPSASLLYMADNALFPYGDLTEEELTGRLLYLFRHLIPQNNITAAVIACNTASTVILEHLRSEFTLPFVGTVPAIKPACSLSKTGFVSVLATPGTVARKYTQKLIDDFAGDVDVFLHGSTSLARMAEDKLLGKPIDLKSLFEEIKPVFQENLGRKTDVVVLGCTHYPLLKDEMIEVSPWPVDFLDTSEAISRRLNSIISNHAAQEEGEECVFLTGKDIKLSKAFRLFGFEKIDVLSV